MPSRSERARPRPAAPQTPGEDRGGATRCLTQVAAVGLDEGQLARAVGRGQLTVADPRPVGTARQGDDCLVEIARRHLEGAGEGVQDDGEIAEAGITDRCLGHQPAGTRHETGVGEWATREPRDPETEERGGDQLGRRHRFTPRHPGAEGHLGGDRGPPAPGRRPSAAAARRPAPGASAAARPTSSLAVPATILGTACACTRIDAATAQSLCRQAQLHRRVELAVVGEPTDDALVRRPRARGSAPPTTGSARRPAGADGS